MDGWKNGVVLVWLEWVFKGRLNKFLIFYNFNRRHGGLRKEIKVRTPYEALKYWYNLKPDLFRSMVFEGREQRGET
ncbi:hypothetical protein [uncultured Gammaproteobacteria bacterium]|nr:hypothetical protein [uncultured Gammaproteobacteria bacterium]CAC9991150.1 hypothetical protein [uncultured Gammaproteobacteria bacterium]CAC9999565.1 hypothetical protein [uncultured Gammaproteobacteria bacterium]